MEDGNMENRVWQRILAGPGESGEDLRPLIYTAVENAMEYYHLLQRSSGQNKESLQQLYRRAKMNVNCLRGLQSLRFGPAGKGNPMPGSGDSMGMTLQRCYHRTRRAMQEYTARSAEPEYGAVFQVMAERERENAALIAELLGMG